MTELVHLDVAAGVATITLDSPANRNALSAQLRRELSAHLDSAIADDAVRVVVLAHTGRVFCAGMDLKETRRSDGRGVNEFPTILERIWNSPTPVVAKLAGPARAGHHHAGPVDGPGQPGGMQIGHCVHHCLGQVVLPLRRPAGPSQRRAGLLGGVALRRGEPGHLTGLGVSGGAADLGQHRGHPGLLVTQLPMLRGEHIEQPVVGHGAQRDGVEGGGQPRTGREIRQIGGDHCRLHDSIIRSIYDQSSSSAIYGRLCATNGTRLGRTAADACGSAMSIGSPARHVPAGDGIPCPRPHIHRERLDTAGYLRSWFS